MRSPRPISRCLRRLWKTLTTVLQPERKCEREENPRCSVLFSYNERFSRKPCYGSENCRYRNQPNPERSIQPDFGVRHSFHHHRQMLSACPFQSAALFVCPATRKRSSRKLPLQEAALRRSIRPTDWNHQAFSIRETETAVWDDSLKKPLQAVLYMSSAI